MQQHPFSTLLLQREETLVIVRFPLTVNVAKLQNNTCITMHAQFPTKRLVPLFVGTTAAAVKTKSEGRRYKCGVLCLNLQYCVMFLSSIQIAEADKQMRQTLQDGREGC